MRWLMSLLLIAICLSPACMYKLGGGLTAGILDEAGGGGRTDGISEVTDRLIADEALRQLGQQLGAGLVSGAKDVTPELQVQVERAVDDILAVAFARAAKGVRDDLSPELREMVRQDIVQALAEGMRGEVSDSLVITVDRVVRRATHSLTEALQDPLLRDAMSSLIRDGTYQAMRVGRPGSPGVGETLETTLDLNLLTPFERSIGGLADAVADRVDESARRTERTLQGVISALILVVGVIAMLYALTRRQLNREREQAQVVTQGLRNVGAALGQLEPEARARLLGKLDEYQRAQGQAGVDYLKEPPAEAPPKRSSDYMRGDE